MYINNFLLRKKRELSSNSTDGDNRKRPREVSSFDDFISKAVNMEKYSKKLQNQMTVLRFYATV